jgi:hypothetical protein
VGREGEVARPLLEGEQLDKIAGGEPAALDRLVAAASWPRSRRRKMRGGACTSARERKGEDRVGRLTGGLARGERGGGSRPGRGGGREAGGAGWAKGQVGR